MDLFATDTETITDRHFAVAVGALGIERGDAILVHSDLAAFGKLAVGASVVVPALTRVLTDTVDCVGAVLMPTFNYDFCHGVPFDPDRTPSKTGAWGRRFLAERDVVRAWHPIFSMAVWDRSARGFADGWTDSFGKDSAFAKLHDGNGKILFWGVGIESCTYIHYVEQCRGVQYRYMKAFNVGRQWCTMYARDLPLGLDAGLDELGARLTRSGEMTTVRVGEGSISAVSAAAVYNEASAMLNEDAYSLTKPERTAD